MVQCAEEISKSVGPPEAKAGCMASSSVVQLDLNLCLKSFSERSKQDPSTPALPGPSQTASASSVLSGEGVSIAKA